MSLRKQTCPKLTQVFHKQKLREKVDSLSWITCWKCRKKIAHRREDIFTMYLAWLSWNTDYEMVNKVKSNSTRQDKRSTEVRTSSGQCQIAYKCNHQLWAVPERVVSDSTSINGQDTARFSFLAVFAPTVISPRISLLSRKSRFWVWYISSVAIITVLEGGF